MPSLVEFGSIGLNPANLRFCSFLLNQVLTLKIPYKYSLKVSWTIPNYIMKQCIDYKQFRKGQLWKTTSKISGWKKYFEVSWTKPTNVRI